MNIEKTSYVRKEKLTKEEFLRVEKDYFVKPTVDIIFKMLFADEKNIGMLKNFLATFLEINESEMEEITIQNPEIPPYDMMNKAVRLDIRVAAAGREINIEMQVSNQDFFKTRTLYYWTSMFQTQVLRGDERYEADETICLNVLDFALFPTKKDYFTKVMLVDVDTGEIYNDDLKLIFLELPKAKSFTLEELNGNDKLSWLAFLKATKEEDLTMLDNVNNVQVVEATGKLRTMQRSPNAKYTAYAREFEIDDDELCRRLARRIDFKKGREEGREEGVQEGLQKGVQEGMQKGVQDTQKEIAMGMASEGLDNELIRRLTGIDVNRFNLQK